MDIFNNNCQVQNNNCPLKKLLAKTLGTSNATPHRQLTIYPFALAVLPPPPPPPSPPPPSPPPSPSPSRLARASRRPRVGWRRVDAAGRRRRSGRRTARSRTTTGRRPPPPSWPSWPSRHRRRPRGVAAGGSSACCSAPSRTRRTYSGTASRLEHVVAVAARAAHSRAVDRNVAVREGDRLERSRYRSYSVRHPTTIDIVAGHLFITSRNHVLTKNITLLAAVLLTVGRSYVGNDVTRSALLDRACACSYQNLPKYRSYRVSNTAPWTAESHGFR